MVKDELILLGNTKNIVSYPQSTVDSLLLGDEDLDKIKDTIKLFLNKTKSHFAHSIIDRQYNNEFNNYDFVSIPKYVLPAVYNKNSRRILLNMSIWGRKDILNIPPQDLYATLVYSYVVAYYSNFDLSNDYIDTICDFMASVYLRLFAKKYGLMGSFVEEIPKLRFLVNMFVLKSFFFYDDKKSYIKAAHLSKINKDKFDVNLDDYDFSNIKDFIKCLSESGVLHGITMYEFASRLIRMFGVASLPMFEDGMRFMATISASSVPGTGIFPITLQKYNNTLYQKILKFVERSVLK